MPSKWHLHNQLNDLPTDRYHVLLPVTQRNHKEECQSTAQASKPQAKYSAKLEIKIKKP